MDRREQAEDSLPVNLLVKGRRFLVVGGGKVALRKTRVLLDAGARITVVSPQARDELVELADRGEIEYVPREFRDSDLDGVFLVFAATDDRSLNRHVLKVARSRGALCCPVDANWPDGDFVTPAIVRRDGLAVAVSTGGRSCRRSRMVKENLARHLEMVETADLMVVGTSHRFLSLEEREPYHLTGGRPAGEHRTGVGEMLMQLLGVHEFMLLATCNRVEFLGIVADEPGLAALVERVMDLDHLGRDRYYVRHGFEAFRHLALVTAGLRSQNPGEDHIVAQVKDALQQADKAGWAGGAMRGWVDCALHLSRDIRQETTSMLAGGEIEDTCVEYLCSIRPPGEVERVTVVGTGTVGRGLVRRLLERNCRCDWFFHTHQPEVPESWADRVEVFSLDGLSDHLPDVEVIICATSSPGHVLKAEHAELLQPDHAAVIFDLGIPRDVAPELPTVAPHVNVHDLDDLKRFYARQMGQLDRAVEVAERIVDEHGEMYDSIIESLQGRNARQ